MSSDSKFIPLELKPGISRDTTSYGSEGSWYQMDKVRFKQGLPQSIGGWQKGSPNTFDGVARYTTNWTTLDTYHTYVGLGTHAKMYIVEGGVFNDITPVSSSVSVSNALSVVTGETSVVVSLSAHDRVAGDYISLLAATTIGGSVLLNGSYLVTSVVDANSFIVDSEQVATATSTNAGGTVTGLIPIHSGYQSNNIVYGYGRSTYGSGPYGMAAPMGLVRKLRKWSGDNWGEDLVFNYKGGPVYVWDASGGTGVRATQITQAPAVNDFINVTYPTRHLMTFGTVDIATSTYDPMLVRWSADEDYTTWTPSGINTAGDYRLQDGSRIVGIQETKAETLAWTDTALYNIKYTGEPYYFSFDVLGKNCGLLSQQATIDVGGTIYWMGLKGFFSYNGQVQTIACPITKDLFEDTGAFNIDKFQKEKIFAGHNSLYREVIWFYQSVNSTTNDCDAYVIFNYDENVFYYGTLNRSCWLDVGLLNNPVGFGTDGFMYTHELGLDADNDALESYIESAEFDMANGEEIVFADRLVPDFRMLGQAAITLKFRKYPNGPVEEKGPYLIEPSTEKVDIRGRGRQLSIKIEADSAGSFWQLGKMRLRTRTNGRN